MTMNSDHPTVTDLFEEFLSACEQIDEPKVDRVTEKIRKRFKKVDSEYRDSEIFKSFLQKVISKITVNPWESMRTVADDLKYHTFFESDQPTGYDLLEEVAAKRSQSSDRRDENTELNGSSIPVASVDPESSQSLESRDSRLSDGRLSLTASVDIEDGQSVESSDENVGDNGNSSSEIDTENSQPIESNEEDEGHCENSFVVEEMLSKVVIWIQKTEYDEVERIHLEEVAKAEKFEKIEELKLNLSKLNLDISKLGSREIPDLNDEILSLSKIRSLMGKYLEVHQKICELSNAPLGREVIKFAGTKIEVIDRAIEQFYNEYDNINLPTLDEIINVIRSTNDKERLDSESKITETAISALQELGRIRNRQRREELHDFIPPYLPMEDLCDPATLSPRLQRKLSENEKLNQERMNFIINKYANQEDIRTHRRSMTRRRSLISDSLMELDLGDFMRLLLFSPSED